MPLRCLITSLTLPVSLFVAMTGCGNASHEKNQEFEDKWLKLREESLKSGIFEEFIPRYREAADQAKARGLVKYQVRFLSDLGNCQFAVFQFREALKTMEETRELAKKIGDRATLAKINSNMSALFQQMGNLDEAANAAEDALTYKDVFDSEPAKQALLFVQLGVVRGKQSHLDKAEVQFAKGIEIAHHAKGRNAVEEALNHRAEAAGWDALAFARLEAGRFQESGEAIEKSLPLHKLASVRGMDTYYMILGRVKAGEGDLDGALKLLDEAEEAVHQQFSRTPPWWIYMCRGQVKLQKGGLRPALEDLREARASARLWRVDVPPNDANRTSSEKLLAQLYQSLIEAGNRLYSETHDPALIRDTFEAAEENRAASLRALLPEENDWRRRLDSHYFAQLSRLQALQAEQMRRGDSNASPALTKLRSELSEIEATAGKPSLNQVSGALDQAQGTLGRDSTLFSFELGDKHSWMWAVTNDSISLHQLPARSELARATAKLERAVGTNAPELPELSAGLYRTLFGTVSPEVLGRDRWLLAPDEELFDLPFPALSPAQGRFLIEDHSLQLAPGARMLRRDGSRPPARGGFLAVGDPIYNQADPRAKKDSMWPWSSLLSRTKYEGGPVFARLWGTGREIEVSAQAWGAEENMLLTGRQVSPENFWQQTGKKPDIIHIATHILEENEKPHAGWIAFSLGPDGRVRYVTPEDVLANSVSARLVVLSGCSSGKADFQPASGLMGLTRAWIGAGAGAVLATRWPTVDDDGAFFGSFYRNLRQSDPIHPAEALRNASKDMLKSGTWRANPSFWTGYFLVNENSNNESGNGIGRSTSRRPATRSGRRRPHSRGLGQHC